MGPRTTKTRHKADNTFRFDTYAEKLARINASIFSDFRGDYSSGALDTDTSEPYFLKCIQKWSDLDISADFMELMEQIGTQIQTLAQIVHDERRLKNVLYEHIDAEKNDSLAATFELVTALESDLGRNFNSERFRYIKKIVNVVVLLKDAGTVEQAFKCLARMIKNGHIATMSSEDFVKYISIAKPLLDSSNVSLQVLACQCFSHSTGQRIKKNPVGTHQEIIDMMSKYQISADGVATLLYCGVRGPQGVYTADGQLILETVWTLCFQGDQHPAANLWNEVILLLVQKLFKRGCTGTDGKKPSDLAIRVTSLHAEIRNQEHAEHYFNLLKIAVASRLSKDGATFGSINSLCVATGLLHVFLKADVPNWSDLTKKQACEILITICTSEKDRLPQGILLAVIKFLSFDCISDQLKLLVLHHLFSHPASLESILVQCQSVLPPGLSSLVIYTDFMINTRKLTHKRFTTTSLVDLAPFHPYASGEICTAVDIMKRTRRPRFRIPQQSAFDSESFWTAMSTEPEDSLYQKCLCFTSDQYIGYIEFFGQENIQSYWNHAAFLPLLLIMSDGYFQAVMHSQMPPPFVPSVLNVVNKLTSTLADALESDDGNDLRLVKTLDFLLAVSVMTSTELNLESNLKEVNLKELMVMMEKYLSSGYTVLRVTAVSICYHIATLLNQDVLKTACEKCLEVELWNLDSPSQSSINKLMEDLVIISKNEHSDGNFLLRYSLGLLFSKYEPIRKQCKTLIQGCLKANKYVDKIVLNILNQSQTHEVPAIPTCLTRITKQGECVLERYELALLDTRSLGNSDPISENSVYTHLNHSEYWALVWEIVATVEDISTVSSPFKTGSVRLANMMLRNYIKIPPHYGFNETPEGEAPSFLVNVVTWLGRCWRYDNVSPSTEHSEVLIHFLMSGNSTFRKAGIEATYNLDRRLENYSDEINAYLEGKIVDLTGFAKETAVPVVKDNSHRVPIMNLVLPLIAQRLWSSLSSKRKIANKSQSPILIGLMGFDETEVERVIDLLIGGCGLRNENYDFTTLSIGNLFRRIRLIELMTTHWKQAFPRLTSRLLSMAVEFIRIVDALEANGEQETEHHSMEVDQEDGKADEKPLISHRRQIVAAGFRIVKFVYETIAESRTLDETVLQEVFKFVIAPRLERLAESSTGGVSTVFHLLKVWSQNPRYRVMLLRALPLSQFTAADALVQVLETKTTSGTVKKFTLEIFFNLLQGPDETNEQQTKNENQMSLLENFDFPELNIETNVLLRLKPILLKYESFSDYLKLVMGSRELCGNLLKVLQLIMVHSCVDDVKQVAPKVISDRLLQSSVSKLKLRIEYLALLREIVNMLPDDDEIIIYLARNFRTRMTPAGKSAVIRMLDGFSDVMCQKALVELSADDPNDVTASDYARRAQGWRILDAMFTGTDTTFSLPRFMVVGNYLIGILSYDKQAVQTQNALRIFSYISKLIKTTQPPADAVKAFFNGVFMSPNLATIVKWKDNTQAFSNILLLLRIFALECSSYDHILQGLAPLCNEDEDQDIICGLTSIQVNNRTKAMNKLGKLLEMQITEEECTKPFPCFGVSLLRDYLVPMATFSIQSERVEKSGANKAQSVLDNLVDCSIRVYRTAAQLFTPMQYLQFVNTVLSQPQADPTYAKRFKRVLLAVINGFKYSLVSPEENGEKLVIIPESQVPALTASFRPLLERLNERLFNFTGKKGVDGTGSVDYSLMAECTLGVAKLLERFPSTLSEPLKDKLVPDICACMKSKEHKTRLLARNTLRTLMSVRTRFISFGRILNYLKANLKVGYQKHVLNHTVFTLLSSCKERFEANPSEIHVQSLLPLCETEFFGIMDEEKGIGKITEKTAEARSPNAKNILELCAQITQTPSDILDMVNCPMEQLKVKRSEKNVSQVKKWLEAVQTGVSNNQNIDLKEVLILLQNKMKAYAVTDAESFSQPRVAAARKKSKVNVNSMEIDALPSRSIRDSLTTERELLLLFQYKLLYNSFRSLNQQVHIAREYYVSAVENLKHNSHEIMLLCHRLVTLFLSWDQTQMAVPASLLPSGSDFNKFWGLLVGNVVKYCETTAAEETVNVIFTSLTTFLSVHTEMKLMKKDLTVLLATLKSFLNNGHCVSSAMKFLTSIIEIKPEAVFLEDIMDDVLKVGTRSTTRHVIEICHKVYLKYLMVYGSSRKGALNGFLNTIWTSAKEATFSHQAANLLVLVNKILGAVPPGSIDVFFRRLPILILELLYLGSHDLQSDCLSIFDTFLGIPEAIPIVVPIACALMTKQPRQYNPYVVLYLVKVFNAVARSEPSSDTFLTNFKHFTKSLVRKSEEFQTPLKVAFQQLEDVVEGFVKDKLWTAKNIRKWKIRKLIQLMVMSGLEESNLTRSSALKIVSFVFRSTLEAGSAELVSRLNPDQPYTGEELPLPFLESLHDLTKLLDSHFGVIEHSTNPQLEATEDVVTRNLNILVQLLCHFGSKSVPPSTQPLTSYFIAKVKRLINREVTQNAEETTVRRICYTLLKTYVHLSDAEIAPYLHIGLPAYEKLKGPYDFDEPPLALLANSKSILLLAVRDSTDSNVKDDIRHRADRLCSLLNGKLGPDLFTPMESEVRQILHKRRRMNKAKKAEAAVTHPGLKRKRSAKPAKKDHKKRVKMNN